MKKSGYKQFVNIRQAENESHIIYVSLTNGTEPIKLDNDMVATVYLEGISKQWESCDIIDNEIVFTVPILNVGDTKCQIQLSNDNGYSISPTFIIVAENILNVPHFELLEEEPDDWVDNAENYYTFDGTDYVPVKYDNENRNILKDIKFSQSPVLVSVPSDQTYKQTPNISVTEGKKIYLSPTNGKTTLSLYVSFYMWNDKSKGTSMGQTKLYTERNNIITVPTIPKRDKNINNYNRVYMYCAVKSTDLDTELHANIQAEYDEQTYSGCKTPYFEKGKYYAMVNDYGNVGNSYNALIQALQEARTYYNKAIKDVSMVDNCLVITYNDNTQYKSEDLKGDGIARLDKSTDGNVDTYTFVTDKGNTFSFTITNADNTKIEDLYTQLDSKTPLAVFNNEVANLKKLINDLDIAKESVEEHNKSVSQLKNSLSIITTQLSFLQSNKIDKDTYTTSIESLQALITKLQNSKVDTNTYSDEIANLTTAIAELKDKQIDTNAIKESITELDTKKLSKEEFNQYKENVANTFASTENEIKANKTSIDKLSIDFNAYKTSNDNAVNNKVDSNDFDTYKITTNKAIDNCVTDLSVGSTGCYNLHCDFKIGSIDKTTGEEKDGSAFITDKLDLSQYSNVTITTDRSTLYASVFEYDTNDKFVKTIADTKNKIIFSPAIGYKYIIWLWYGGTDFTKIAEAHIKGKSINTIAENDTRYELAKETCKLDLPDAFYIQKGGTLELFKYGMYYNNYEFVENKYNVRLVNLSGYITEYSDKIVITCPADYTDETLRNPSDLPLFQLLDRFGKVIDSKRVKIYVADITKIADKTRRIMYLGDSFTGMAVRSGETANLISQTRLTDTKLIGRSIGQGSGNKFTGTGGYSWANYTENPNTLPAAYPNNYLWVDSYNNISMSHFVKNVLNEAQLDYLVVLLGWNDYENGAFASKFNWSDLKMRAKKLIENTHAGFPNCKIILESYHYMYPHKRKSYGNTMPQVRQNKYVYDLNKLYQEIANEYDYVTFVQMSCQIDVLHNMTMESTKVNKRSEKTVEYCKDCVHPANEGFYQYSDAEFIALTYLMGCE